MPDIAPANVWPELDGRRTADKSHTVFWQRFSSDDTYRITTSSSAATHWSVSLSSQVGLQPYPGSSSVMALKGSKSFLLQLVTDTADSTFYYHADVWLAGQPITYLSLPGTTGNYASVDDADALDVTGDLSLVALASADDLSAGEQIVLSKWNTAGNQRSYYMSVNTSAIRLLWSEDGTSTGTVAVASSTVPVADDTLLWMRADLDVDDGAGGYTVKFYTSTYTVGADPSWSQLGSASTGTTTTSVNAGTAVGTVGYHGAGSLLTGNVYRAQVWDGAYSGGTKVLDISFTDPTQYASTARTSLTAITRQTVTINQDGTPPAQIVEGDLDGATVFAASSSDGSMYVGSSSSTGVFALSTAQDSTSIFMGTQQPSSVRGVRFWEAE